MFQVMAEAKDGGTYVLRRNFATEEAALDHPVKMSHWKRVWVERANDQPERDTSPPSLPWSVEWSRGHAYVLDAKGKKIAALLGTQERREMVAEILYRLNEQPKDNDT